MVTMIRNEAIEKKGWWKAYRWLILRRINQILFFGAFALYAYWGVALVKGSLTSSLWFNTIPATESLTFLQGMIARPSFAADMWSGGLILLLVGSLLGARLFCGWICPINILSDFTHWLKGKLGLKGGISIRSEMRYVVLIFILIASMSGQFIAWESLSPISNTYRALLFLTFGALWFAGLIMLLDLLILKEGFCKSLCPQGALYHLIGNRRIFGIKAVPNRCTTCGNCYKICPEEKILHAPLRSKKQQSFVQSGLCTGCGQCIDVCCENVLKYGFYIEKKGNDK